ncbi:MAG TPA: hypothetical protein VGB62_09125 [Allosphingosinicella sp.]|jgi:hypothetical protein
MTESEGKPWWELRSTALALVLLTAIPLLWPNVPPLVDLPGHMARYRVQLEIAHSPALQHFYYFDWALIGNLGVDLLVIPLSKLFGLEGAVKLIVLSIPVMTVAGFLWVAREVHGRVPPTAYFAVPLAYNFPFHFGFVNFGLSMAFAFLAFGLWLRLARLGRLKLRAILFIPISVLVWVTHTFGWGTLGVMAFSAELVRQLDLKRPLIQTPFRAGFHAAAIAPPILLMLAWRTGGHVSGKTTDWFNWERKWDWVRMALRDRWELFDAVSLGIIALVLVLGFLLFRRLQYSRNLLASAIFLLLVYLLLPRIVFGSAYADMRLVPYMIAVAVLAIRFKPGKDLGKLGATFAMAGLAFVLVRTAGTTWSFALYDQAYDRNLPALEHVPFNARLITFVGRDCNNPWSMSRLEHIPGMATVRRRAYSNDQWSMPGAQLLTVRYRAKRRFVADPSQMVVSHWCRGEMWMPIDYALFNMPREAYDYVWLVQPPAHDPRLTSGLVPLWRNGTSVLYRVADRNPPALARQTSPR